MSAGKTPFGTNASALQHQAAICLKELTGELFYAHYLPSGGKVHPVKKGQQMAWKAPKIVEVSVGMEINMYMCATRK